MLLTCSANHVINTKRPHWGSSHAFRKKGGKCGELVSYDVMSGSSYCQRRLRKTTVREIIENHIAALPPKTILRSKTLWIELFKYNISRQSITTALSSLAKDGYIKRSSFMRGKNSFWVVICRDDKS